MGTTLITGAKFLKDIRDAKELKARLEKSEKRSDEIEKLLEEREKRSEEREKQALKVIETLVEENRTMSEANRKKDEIIMDMAKQLSSKASFRNPAEIMRSFVSGPRETSKRAEQRTRCPAASRGRRIG